MSRKLYQGLFIFALFMGLLFINIDGVKAVDNGNKKGYAKCYYTWIENTVETGGYVADGQNLAGEGLVYGKHCRAYKLGIAAYKATDGNFYAWGELGCGEGSNPWSKKTTGTCTIENGTYYFNQFKLNGLSYFVSNGYNKVMSGRADPKWVCPSKIYIGYKAEAADQQYLYFTKKECEESGYNLKHCQTASLSGSDVKQTSKKSQPSELKVNNYKINENCDVEAQSTTDRAVDEAVKGDIDPSQVIADDSGFKKDEDTSISTCDLIPPKIIEFLRNFFLIIQVLGIVLLVVMTMIEFLKAVTASDEDGLKGAIKNTYRRIIIVIALLLLPMFIIWILNIVNANAYVTDDDGNYVIGENGDPLCKK